METVGRIIPIGDGTEYRMRCTLVGKYSSVWTLEEYLTRKFLWWKWEGWETLVVVMNYGAGNTKHIFDVRKKHDEPDEVVLYWGESSLNYIGLEYE